MIVVCDLEVAGHLTLALEVYGRLMRDAGRPLPPGLATTARELRNQVTAGQGGSFADALQVAVDAVGMDDQLLYTYDDAAARLSVSTSTVKRLVSSGRLRTVKVGSSPRVHRDELERYAAGLTGGVERKEHS